MADQEVRDQERMLNQEEKGRILDRDAQREQRRLHRMEVIQQTVIWKEKGTELLTGLGEAATKLSLSSNL